MLNNYRWFIKSMGERGLSYKCMRRELDKIGISICNKTIYKYLSSYGIKLKDYRDGNNHIAKKALYSIKSRRLTTNHRKIAYHRVSSVA